MKALLSDQMTLRKFKAATVGKSFILRVCFRLFCAVAMSCAATTAAQTDQANRGGQAIQLVSTGSADPTGCASCHQEVISNFASNPHDRVRTPGGKGVTCESCHGPSQAHKEDGHLASIFNPATAAANVVDEKCQACHGGRHVNFERSSHGKGNVSCIGCHSIHTAVSPKHLLKLAQPDLCYQCHKEIRPQFSMPFRHKVAEGLIQCTDCHDAHGADRESEHLASSWQFDECTKCHVAAAGPFVYQHAVVKAGSCTACHLPHGGANSKLLIQANMSSVCLQCHSPTLNSTTGQPAAPSHGHSAPGQSCINCHSSIHGSNASELFLEVAPEKSVH